MEARSGRIGQVWANSDQFRSKESRRRFSLFRQVDSPDLSAFPSANFKRTIDQNWAVLIEKDGVERLYFVVETKGRLFKDDLRGTEGGKIERGKAHFKALAVGDNPAGYVVATEFDDLTAIA